MSRMFEKILIKTLWSLNWSFLLVIPLCINLSACSPNENPDVIIPQPEVQTIELDAMGQSAHYYSLADKKIQFSHGINEWDLKLCAQKDKFYIYVNTAKHMKTAKYEGKFSDRINPDDIKNWQYDLVNSNREESSIGHWGDFSFNNPKSFGYTYILDLGYLNKQAEFGYKKIQIMGCNEDSYFIKYANLDDTDGDTLKIQKNVVLNYMHLSFKDKASIVDIEPPSSKWDLLFTQYGLSTLLDKGGSNYDTINSWTDFVILNTLGRQVYCDTVKAFDKITFWDAESYTYSNKFDFIGNAWRVCNSVDNTCTVSDRKIYVIKDMKNNIYKLEFKSFKLNRPGSVKIEFIVKNL